MSSSWRPAAARKGASSSWTLWAERRETKGSRKVSTSFYPLLVLWDSGQRYVPFDMHRFTSQPVAAKQIVLRIESKARTSCLGHGILLYRVKSRSWLQVIGTFAQEDCKRAKHVMVRFWQKGILYLQSFELHIFIVDCSDHFACIRITVSACACSFRWDLDQQAVRPSILRRDSIRRLAR
jgi:hypothetical protein